MCTKYYYESDFTPRVFLTKKLFGQLAFIDNIKSPNLWCRANIIHEGIA